MILFITSAALLYWAFWLYYQHVIKPIRDEQIADYNENAKASKSLGNSQTVCQTAVIEECPDCNGSTVVKAFINKNTRLFYLADCNRCNGQGIIELN
jgi:DnaJ-class molecular chaperone